jgi:nucleoside 2-deoxyribosyltransferase
MRQSGRRIYFARAVEGIERSQIRQLAASARLDVNAVGLTLIDAHMEYLAWRDLYGTASESDEYKQIVKFQLELLRSCDALLMDMTIPNRNYIGCCCELVYACQFNLPTAVYVGDTNYASRTWLRYHAQVVVRERREAIAHLSNRLRVEQ